MKYSTTSRYSELGIFSDIDGPTDFNENMSTTNIVLNVVS